MQYILSVALSLIPLLSISFVTILIIYKFYVKIRSNFKVTVNCWFCNQNTKVPYLESNSFTCPSCQQYNGFTKDGDYNREIYEQLDCSNLSLGRKEGQQYESSDLSEHFPANGFCHVCNEGQRLKVEKLAQFEPKNESKFDEELKAYKNKLEEQYGLCTTCDRHLKRVLREKKKMVLGSKFLDYIIKGAETFRQPHFARLKRAQKAKLKQKLAIYLGIVAFINAFCIIRNLPDPTKDSLTSILGDKAGHYVFLLISHVLALGKVFISYTEAFGNYPTLQKLGLFFRTIIMMVLYSMGMKLPQMAALNMTSMLVIVNPFVMLGLAFIYHLVDGIKLNRFTFMLTMWSLCAGGLLDYEQVVASKEMILLAGSIVTIYMALSNKLQTHTIADEYASSSFHKIYSEDCLNDEDTRETISLISQRLNGSGNSTLSNSSNRSFLSQSQLSPLNGARLVRSPITSSVFSLNDAQRSPSFCSRENQFAAPPREFASSVSNFPLNRPLFASNLELNSSRPLSTFGSSASINSSLVFGTNPVNHAKQLNDSFPKANHTSVHYASPPLASPFSASNNSVYQRSNLLTPSRFTINSLTTNNPSASWLSGGYFNSAHVGVTQTQTSEKQGYPLEHRKVMNTIPENISRASSQSSGFESQSSAPLRENSICPEPDQHHNQNISSMSDLQTGFYPIDKNNVFQRPSTILNTSFQQPLASPIGSLRSFSSMGSQINVSTALPPLSVNCNQDYWKPTRAYPINSSSNAFNLCKINEELPSIQRGALLKKWVAGQAL